jgi:membrane protein DedA with SNARE-associated domain
VLTPARREKLDRHYARHAFWTVAVARHAGGLRLAAFTLAGATGVRYRTFLLADALSGLVSVPIVATVGYVLWHHLSEARRGVHAVQLGIGGLVALGIALVLLLRWRANRRAPSRAPAG